MDVPSGKSPLSPVSVFFPRNQPSPKSSSRSTSSMRSPRRRLSSSGLRAWNSSAVVLAVVSHTSHAGRALTDDDESIAGPAILGMRWLHVCGGGGVVVKGASSAETRGGWSEAQTAEVTQASVVLHFIMSYGRWALSSRGTPDWLGQTFKGLRRAPLCEK